MQLYEHGLELRLRLNDGPVCDAQRLWGSICSLWCCINGLTFCLSFITFKISLILTSSIRRQKLLKICLKVVSHWHELFTRTICANIYVVVLAWVFTRMRMFVWIVRANSSRRSLCQMQFARTTCDWSQFLTNILHTYSGRLEVVSKIRTICWPEQCTWIFAISLRIPSQIDARQPATRWLSLGDLLISVFV